MNFEENFEILKNQVSRLFVEVPKEISIRKEYRLTDTLIALPTVIENKVDDNDIDNYLIKYFEKNPNALSCGEITYGLLYSRFSFAKEETNYLTVRGCDLINPDKFNYDHNKVLQSLNHYFFLRILRLEGIKFLKKCDKTQGEKSSLEKI